MSRRRKGDSRQEGLKADERFTSIGTQREMKGVWESMGHEEEDE